MVSAQGIGHAVYKKLDDMFVSQFLSQAFTPCMLNADFTWEVGPYLVGLTTLHNQSANIVVGSDTPTSLNEHKKCSRNCLYIL